MIIRQKRNANENDKENGRCFRRYSRVALFVIDMLRRIPRRFILHKCIAMDFGLAHGRVLFHVFITGVRINWTEPRGREYYLHGVNGTADGRPGCRIWAGVIFAGLTDCMTG